MLCLLHAQKKEHPIFPVKEIERGTLGLLWEAVEVRISLVPRLTPDVDSPLGAASLDWPGAPLFR